MTIGNLTAIDVTVDVLRNAELVFDHCLEKISHCLNQLADEQVWWRPHEEQNSIGNLLLHLTGNVQQWIVAGLGSVTDVRDRPSEFSTRGPISSDELQKDLRKTVEQAKNILHSASPESMAKTYRIQGFEVSGWCALFDCIPHFKGHTQEIICLTRMQLRQNYQFHWQPQTPEQGAPVDP
ncbi:MAG: DUF1572 family protein [Planctomycetales bacterium]|nr:DUF1572 family protein [Planctomycetales bacterium]